MFQNETKGFVTFWTTCAVLGIPDYRGWELYFVREIVKTYETYDVNFIRQSLEEIPLALKLAGSDLSAISVPLRAFGKVDAIEVLKKLPKQDDNYLSDIIKQYKEIVKPKMDKLREHNLESLILMGALSKY